ncbi:MAG: aminotransferase class I/II-fold pyridoxal phosphate-dependent enzyme [Myxococcota bacterium]
MPLTESEPHDPPLIIGQGPLLDALAARLPGASRLTDPDRLPVSHGPILWKPRQGALIKMIAALQPIAASAQRRHQPMLLLSRSIVYGNNPADLNEAATRCLGVGASGDDALNLAAVEQAVRHASLPRVCVARLFPVYGPGVNDDLIAAMRDELSTDLAIRRPDDVVSPCYIDDAVEGVLKLLERLIGSNGGILHRRIINVGRRDPVSVGALARMLLRLTGLSGRFQDAEGGGRHVPDVSALTAVTGFVAQTDLETGLRKTLGMPLGPGTAARPVYAVHPRLAPDERLGRRVLTVLHRRQLSNHGPQARALEHRIAERLQAEAVVAVSSGSAALLLSSLAMGLQGAAVLPAFTFMATAAAATQAGLQPVFCDIDPDRWTMDPDHLEQILAEREDVSLILPVTVYGTPPELGRINALAHQAGAAVIHDAAHAFGTVVSGQPVGSAPGVHAFSMHATKVLSAVEGGLVVTDDRAFAAEVHRLANHGFPQDRLQATPGYNFHFDEVRAEIAHHSLDQIDAILTRRRRSAERIRAAAERFAPQHIPDAVRSNFQELGVRFPQAREIGISAVLDQLRRHGVEGRRYFYPALHHTAGFRALGADLPITDRIVEQVLCLPLQNHMPPAFVDRVVAALKGMP